MLSLIRTTIHEDVGVNAPVDVSEDFVTYSATQQAATPFVFAPFYIGASARNVHRLSWWRRLFQFRSGSRQFRRHLPRHRRAASNIRPGRASRA